MALPVTSGTAAFLVTRDDIIKASLQALKVIPQGVSPASNDLTDCARDLNMLLKTFAVMGYLKWLYQRVVFPLTANKQSYTIGEVTSDVINYAPIKIARGWRRDTTTTPNLDIPLVGPLSVQEYDQLTPKTQSGIPTSFYYDPQPQQGIIYPWPIPTDATQSMGISIQRPVQDITGATQNFDLPQEFFTPLKWMLADEVSHSYEVDLQTITLINQRAERWRKIIGDFDQEDASFIAKPDPQVAMFSMGRFES